MRQRRQDHCFNYSRLRTALKRAAGYVQMKHPWYGFPWMKPASSVIRNQFVQFLKNYHTSCRSCEGSRVRARTRIGVHASLIYSRVGCITNIKNMNCPPTDSFLSCPNSPFRKVCVLYGVSLIGFCDFPVPCCRIDQLINT